jgi:SAM-dependent methyltransferase
MNPTERFTDRADDYVSGRPSYPVEAIDALFADLGDPAALTVVDIGAGTGISSRLLADRGAAVFAIEPNASMRERATAHDRVSWLAGTAEHTGLPDGAADLVVAFQAFHWFRYDEALHEMHRIVRSDGRVALVYNERSPENAFTRGYDAIVQRYATDRTEPQRHDGRVVFEHFTGWSSVKVHEFANTQRLTRAGVFARAGSTSYLPRDGEAGESLRRELAEVFDACAIDDTVDMQMKTIVSIATPISRVVV